MTSLFLTVGMPCAGKTTRARQLADEHRALRLTPDEWMIPLFGDPEADGKRDVLEARLLRVGLDAVRVGTDVILDFGCWSRDERSAIRCLTRSAGAVCRLVYLPVTHEVQRSRMAHRRAEAPEGTFTVDEADLLRFRGRFEAPDTTELEGREIDDPPPGWRDWTAWAAGRWPSFA